MKKHFFYLLLFTFYFLLSPSSYGFYPIIIKKSHLGNPPYNSEPKKDVQWHTNDIEGATTIACEDKVTISQSFEPQTSGSGSSATNTPYDVTEISAKNIWGDKFYSNPALVNMSYHLQGRYKVISGTDNIRKAFLSMDVKSKFGNSGIDDKATNFRQQVCYKGQRIIKAIEGGDQVVMNEKVAWKCGGRTIPANDVNGSNPGGCDPVTLADIAAAYDPYLVPSGDYTTCQAVTGNPIPTPQYVFFNPQDNCSFINYHGDDKNYPTPRAGNPSRFGVSPQNKAGITANQACVLFHNVVKAADSGSLGSSITIWDHNLLTGQYENPQTEVINLPRGAIMATYQPFSKFSLSAKQTVISNDFCSTGDGGKIMDKPNRVSLIAKIINTWGTIIDTAKTFSGFTKTVRKFDSRANIDTDQTQLNTYLPLKYQQQKNTVVLPASTTNDSRNIDPGIAHTRFEYAKMLLPYKWH